MTDDPHVHVEGGVLGELRDRIYGAICGREEWFVDAGRHQDQTDAVMAVLERFGLISVTHRVPLREDLRRFRRFRPWMWGPLRHLWMAYWSLHESRFTHYRWKTGQDRKSFARLDKCCKEDVTP